VPHSFDPRGAAADEVLVLVDGERVHGHRGKVPRREPLPDRIGARRVELHEPTGELVVEAGVDRGAEPPSK
jgi:hypothetical protein